MVEPKGPDWYDREYFEGPTKSSYQPYGPGDWCDDLCDMIVEILHPSSVLDVGCAYGYVVSGLLNRGVDAYGFDHSPFAVGRAVLGPDRIRQADVTDPQAWRFTDLVTATEIFEHLSDEQVQLLLRHALHFAKRVLVLVTTPDNEHATEDESHVNVQPMDHWAQLAWDGGWVVRETESYRFNTDQRAERMEWAGRFLYLEKPGDG